MTEGETEMDTTYNEQLLEKYRKSRDELLTIIEEIEELKTNIKKLFPTEKLDNRHIRLFEEKIKTTTNLFQLILDIRKEYSRQIAQELELRNKLGNNEDDFLGVNIRDLVKKISDVDFNVFDGEENNDSC